MILKQTLIISSVSLIVLLLASSITIYFYRGFVRPEIVDPKSVEKKLKVREKNIEAALNDSRTKLSESFKSALIPKEQKEQLPKELTPEDLTGINENPIKMLFKTIEKTLKKQKSELDTAKPIKEHLIEKILLPSQTGKTEGLLKETVVPDRTAESAPSNEVIKTQIGLSLNSAKMYAAVYKIRNLFGKPGLIGHLFVMVGKKNPEDFFNLEESGINFSSLESFKLSIKNPGILVDSKFIGPVEYKHQLIINNRILLAKHDNEIEEAVQIRVFDSNMIPEGSENNKIIFNTYKWLHWATIVSSVVSPGQTVYALVFREGEKEPPGYLDDVQEFDFNWMKTSDRLLYSGDIKRILNHCRDYLNDDSITL